MNSEMKKIVQNYALVSAAIVIVYTVIGYVMGDPSLFTTWWLGILIAVAGIVITVLGANKFKASQGGFMSFKDAFMVSFLILFVAGLISTLFNMLMFNVIDPEFAEQLNQAILENTINAIEKFGAPEATITEQIYKMEAQGGQFSFGNQVKSFGMGLIFYAIIALIIAAFTKKKAPEFMDTDNAASSEA